MTAAVKSAPDQVEYQLFDVVATRSAVPNVSGRTIAAGTLGTIVEIFDTPWLGYMIEFPEDDELSLPILRPEQIAPWVPEAAKA